MQDWTSKDKYDKWSHQKGQEWQREHLPPESTSSEESLEEGGDTAALTMKMRFNTNK